MVAAFWPMGGRNHGKEDAVIRALFLFLALLVCGTAMAAEPQGTTPTPPVKAGEEVERKNEAKKPRMTKEEREAAFRAVGLDVNRTHPLVIRGEKEEGR